MEQTKEEENLDLEEPKDPKEPEGYLDAGDNFLITINPLMNNKILYISKWLLCYNTFNYQTNFF